MPIIGVICGKDGTYQDFATCIKGHESMDPMRNCNCPAVSIKSQRDNSKHRSGAGISVTMLLSCPRAVAIERQYDLYENVESGWHKFRGSLTHALFEADPDPPQGVVMERRIVYTYDVDGHEFRLTGKPDYIDPTNHVLIDFKSKHLLPKYLDDNHEAQLNLYKFLIEEGSFMDTNERVDIQIDRMGIHYVTFHTKTGMIWKKVLYPVWERGRIESVIQERSRNLLNVDTELPACSPYIKNARWKCQCQKWEEQLNDRGIEL